MRTSRQATADQVVLLQVAKCVARMRHSFLFRALASWRQCAAYRAAKHAAAAHHARKLFSKVFREFRLENLLNLQCTRACAWTAYFHVQYGFMYIADTFKVLKRYSNNCNPEHCLQEKIYAALQGVCKAQSS